MFFRKQKNRSTKYGYKKNFKKNISTVAEKWNGIKKTFFLALLIVFFGSGIYWVSSSGYFKIKKITVDGAEENQEIKTYFKKFIGKNLIFVKLEETTEKIKKENPNLEKFEVEKNYPKEIRIIFSKYRVVANVEYFSPKKKQKFKINEIGYIVEKNAEDPNLPVLRIVSEKEMEENAPVIAKEKLGEILRAMAFFEEKFGMKIVDATYLMRAREAHLRTEKLFGVWLDAQKPLESQLNKLRKAVPRLDIYNLPLEYIDLRISGANGEKIIYRKTK